LALQLRQIHLVLELDTLVSWTAQEMCGSLEDMVPPLVLAQDTSMIFGCTTLNRTDGLGWLVPILLDKDPTVRSLLLAKHRPWPSIPKTTCISMEVLESLQVPLDIFLIFGKSQQLLPHCSKERQPNLQLPDGEPRDCPSLPTHPEVDFNTWLDVIQMMSSGFMEDNEPLLEMLSLTTCGDLLETGPGWLEPTKPTMLDRILAHSESLAHLILLLLAINFWEAFPMEESMDHASSSPWEDLNLEP